jgi:hypothetical protein
MLVSAFITPGGLYMLLLHEGRNEENVRLFFNEAYALYTKQLLNPFTIFDAPIVSPAFDEKIRLAARRFLF